MRYSFIKDSSHIKKETAPKYPYTLIPFESAWAVFEKFRYINSLSKKDLGKILIKPSSKRLGRSLELYELRDLDKNLVIKTLGFDLIEQNNKDISLITKSNKVNDTLKKMLWYCPICIKYGYHSLLFQFKYLQKCPHHNITLKYGCPNCHNQELYRIDYQKEVEPFHCYKCKYSFITKDEFKSEFQLKSDPQLIKWMTSKEQLELDYLISTSYSSDKTHSEINNKHTTEELLLLIDGKNKFETTKNHIVFRKKVNQNIYMDVQIHKRRIQKLGISSYMEYFPQNYSSLLCLGERRLSVDYFLEEVSNKLFSAVSRWMRKNLLKGHKKCIKCTLENYNDLIDHRCPVAFAFVLWMKKCKRLRNVSYLTTKHNGPNIHLDGVFPTINPYNFILERVRDDWLFLQQKRGAEIYEFDYSTLEWLISKILEKIFIADFRLCLQAAFENVSNNISLEESKMNIKCVNLSPPLLIKQLGKEENFLASITFPIEKLNWTLIEQLEHFCVRKV